MLFTILQKLAKLYSEDKRFIDKSFIVQDYKHASFFPIVYQDTRQDKPPIQVQDMTSVLKTVPSWPNTARTIRYDKDTARDTCRAVFRVVF
jgi:hypothetical protein